MKIEGLAGCDCAWLPFAKALGFAGTEEGGMSTPLGEGNGAIGARSAKATPPTIVSDKPKDTTKAPSTLENDRFIKMSLNVIDVIVLFIVFR